MGVDGRSVLIMGFWSGRFPHRCLSSHRVVERKHSTQMYEKVYETKKKKKKKIKHCWNFLFVSIPSGFLLMSVLLTPETSNS